MTSDETIFDKVINNEIPCKKVYEDEWVLAFHDINPQAPVHVLVIPKKKVSGFAKLKNEDAAEIGEFISRVSKVADILGLEENGYRIVFNQGQFGQQTVEYIHAHIMGGRQMNWPAG